MSEERLSEYLEACANLKLVLPTLEAVELAKRPQTLDQYMARVPGARVVMAGGSHG